MTVSAISSSLGITDSQSTSSTGTVEDTTMDFYNLLTTQLTNQNPLEPVKETEFLGQMAQFSTVEQLQGLTAGMTASQTEQRWLDAQDYLGRKVQWSTGDETTASGEVDRVDRDEDGEIWLEVNGEQVSIDDVIAVSPGDSSSVGDDIR